MKRSRSRLRPMSEINVVPYIDVMLVLLVIFMVTAPLITQGVKVTLPQASAQPLPGDGDPPVIIHVDQFGDLYVDVGTDKNLPVDEATLLRRIRTVLQYKPGTPVMVRGDSRVDYGRVIRAMVVAQAAGAPDVGLITEPSTQTRGPRAGAPRADPPQELPLGTGPR
jgi:biopolymer transport protein TolR